MKICVCHTVTIDYSNFSYKISLSAFVKQFLPLSSYFNKLARKYTDDF